MGVYSYTTSPNEGVDDHIMGMGKKNKKWVTHVVGMGTFPTPSI